MEEKLIKANKNTSIDSYNLTVIYEEASIAKNATAEATSCGSPIRFCGVWSIILLIVHYH
jgi:hypothetical protein